MAANTGRSVTFLWGGSAVLGIREKGITINGEPIDITSGEDSGNRTLLDTDVAERSLDISISGVVKDHRFISDISGGTYQRAFLLTFANGATFSGTAQIVNVSLGLPYKDAQTFDASLQSSGDFTFVAGV